MNKLIVYCCLIFFVNITKSFSQDQKWDSTYRPDIYSSRVELFKSLKHSKKDIVFLGNSLVFWAEWNELLGCRHLKNRGIPGDITFGVLERLDEVINGKPLKVFILIGINDIARKIPDSAILQNYLQMIRRIKSGSPHTKLFLQTLLPTNGLFNKLPGHYQNDHIKHINEGLKKIATTENIVLIDLYSAFVDAAGNLAQSYTFDGVHLTAEGYHKWAELLKKGKYLR